jgi:polysaccharide chain length determinant protein (PEP-CTERM system associated)
MTDFTQRLLTTLRGIWRHRWLGIVVAWCIALIGAVAVQLTPERFEARARLYVDTQTVLKPLMAGLAFQPDIDQQVRMLGRTLVSRPNAELLVNDPKVGLLEGSHASVDQLADDLTKAIKVEQTPGNNLYAISYRDSDPGRAHRVVEGLVNIFIDSGADSKRRGSEDASRFIDEQIKAYESKLSTAESKLKEFKLRNMGVATSTGGGDYFARITAITDDIARLQVQARASERSRDALKHELSQEQPLLPVEAVAVTAAPAPLSSTPDLDARIEAQRRQLDEMLRRYTDEHPDVISTRRTIGQLEAQRRQEAEAHTRSAAAQERSRAATATPQASKGPQAPTSPVFQKLRVALAEAEASLSSLQGQIDAQQRRSAEIRAQASRAPQAEAELAQLNRDYDIIRKNYDQLVSRREAASLGVKIDQNGALTDFRLVEPPRVMPTPVFPGKRVLALGVMVLALVIGTAAAYARSLLTPTFASERELREFTRRPVLGSLGLVADPTHSAVVRHDRQRVMLAMGAYLIAHTAWMGWVILHSAG